MDKDKRLMSMTVDFSLPSEEVWLPSRLKDKWSMNEHICDMQLVRVEVEP